MYEAKKPQGARLKIVKIEWADGGSTTLTVSGKTDVLAAYEPALSHIKRITETEIKTNINTVIYEKE